MNILHVCTAIKVLVLGEGEEGGGSNCETQRRSLVSKTLQEVFLTLFSVY